MMRGDSDAICAHREDEVTVWHMVMWGEKEMWKRKKKEERKKYSQSGTEEPGVHAELE